MLMSRHALWALALAACAAPDEPAVTTTTRALDLAGCADFECGGNAASLGDGIVFHELHLGGLVNSGGVRITGARDSAGAPVSLAVDGDDLTATTSGGTTLREDGLVDTIISLTRDGVARYELRVASFRHTVFWARPVDEVPVYELRFRKLRDPRDSFDEHDEPWPGRPLCKGDQLDTQAEWKDLRYTALVFEGDRYDAARKTVRPNPPDGWFNLACAGTAVAKMHLLRHTHAGRFVRQGVPQETTIVQRLAMLKMLTADYCGGGRSYTANGHPLRYTDALAWYPSPPLGLKDPAQVRSIEAIWGPDGAVCLDVPRLYGREVIARECVRPKCDLTDWKSAGHVISANPPLALSPPPAAACPLGRKCCEAGPAPGTCARCVPQFLACQ